MRQLYLYKLIHTTCALAALLVVSSPSFAQTCTVSMGNMVFGSINTLTGAAVDTTATMTVTCSGGQAQGQRLCISIGGGSASDATSRMMTSGANTARYDLYSNSTRTTLWGSWETGYDTAGVQLDVNRGSTTNITVYGRFLASQQTAPVGSYTATFTANPFVRYGNKQGAPNCPTGGLTSSTSFSATATVLSTCNVGATAVNFGSQGVLVGNTDAQATLSIQCSASLPYTVSLNGGTSGATDPTQRKMSFSGANVTYGLYQDAARALPWGSTVGTNTTSGTGTGVTQTQTVYGRAPPQTTPKPGAYSDSVIVTVGY
jgi:spore coat protein U domain-containing protein, fimbrial subunit CupE1/2/3/6